MNVDKPFIIHNIKDTAKDNVDIYKKLQCIKTILFKNYIFNNIYVYEVPENTNNDSSFSINIIFYNNVRFVRNLISCQVYTVNLLFVYIVVTKVFFRFLLRFKIIIVVHCFKYQDVWSTSKKVKQDVAVKTVTYMSTKCLP